MFGGEVCNTLIARSVRIYAPWNLKLESANIAPGVRIYNKAKITIGDFTVISQRAYLCTASHDVDSPRMELVVKPIEIQARAWVAAQAIVLPGVFIGEGAVVGAGSVVSKDVAPWTVVAGNPAKFIKNRVVREEQ